MSDQMELVQQEASKVVLPELKLTQPCECSRANTAAVAFNDPVTQQRVTYHQKTSTDFQVEAYHHFPVVLKTDGSPWQHAVVYLLHKLEALILPNSKTLESIANDLVMFRRYIDESGFDYLEFPKRKLRRPTYRYRAELQRLMRFC